MFQSVTRGVYEHAESFHSRPFIDVLQEVLVAQVYDVIVLGVGGMGSATCHHLARRGAKVLGLEQFSLNHDRGSSHGESRMIRQAYFEHPDYVPLLLRAYELWSELEQTLDQTLFYRTGVMISGGPNGEAFAGAKLAASLHHLPLEELTAESAAARWPSFRFPSDHSVAFEPAAGLLLVEKCVQSHIELARRFGAEVRANENVCGWSSNGQTVAVKTQSGEFQARSLVVTAGAWASRCISDLGVPLSVLRKVVAWFPIRTGEYRIEQKIPAYFFDLPHGRFYGFPSLDGKTIKIAEHSGGQPIDDPTVVDRSLLPVELQRLQATLADHMPGIDPSPERHSTCLYTMSPDSHFIVDLHPQWKNVAIACGFSGHGFKFVPVIGEVLADLALNGRTEHSTQFLGLSRFQ